MSAIHLVLGGIRSGKSAFAEQLVTDLAEGRPVAYLATGVITDPEMAERVRVHRQRRPGDWRTVEAPLNPVGALTETLVPGETPPLLLLDSLDGWMSNLLMEHEGTAPTEMTSRTVGAVRRFAAFVREIDTHAVVVSSEVGQSLVATSSLGRRFQDLLGTVNQAMATEADAATLVVAGLPVALKRPKG